MDCSYVVSVRVGVMLMYLCDAVMMCSVMLYDLFCVVYVCVWCLMWLCVSLILLV